MEDFKEELVESCAHEVSADSGKEPGAGGTEKTEAGEGPDRLKPKPTEVVERRVE